MHHFLGVFISLDIRLGWDDFAHRHVYQAPLGICHKAARAVALGRL